MFSVATGTLHYNYRRQIPTGMAGGAVRTKGLEPPRLTAPDPKSGASTNSATSALVAAKIVKNGETGKLILDFYDTRRLMRMLVTTDADVRIVRCG